MALNYKLLPVGSLKNIVYCYPINPLKRRQGFIINSTFRLINL